MAASLEKGAMIRTLIALLGAIALIVGPALAAETTREVGTALPVTVREGSAVVIAPGAEVALGATPAELAPGARADAYEPEDGSGLLQWFLDGTAGVIALMEQGRVVAVSVAHLPEARTVDGVALGDAPDEVLRVYGEAVRDGTATSDALLVTTDAYLVVTGSEPSAFTYFDTTCAPEVTQIGLALDDAGVRQLASLWAPVDSGDPCGVDAF